jgi:hypothetical protein
VAEHHERIGINLHGSESYRDFDPPSVLAVLERAMGEAGLMVNALTDKTKVPASAMR